MTVLLPCLYICLPYCLILSRTVHYSHILWTGLPFCLPSLLLITAVLHIYLIWLISHSWCMAYQMPSITLAYVSFCKLTLFEVLCDMFSALICLCPSLPSVHPIMSNSLLSCMLSSMAFCNPCTESIVSLLNANCVIPIKATSAIPSEWLSDSNGYMYITMIISPHTAHMYEVNIHHTFPLRIGIITFVSNSNQNKKQPHNFIQVLNDCQTISHYHV